MATKFLPKRRHSLRRTYHKLLLILAAALLVFLYSHLSKSRRASDAKRTPLHDIADKPRFLYLSRFRDHPDYDYEAAIDMALRAVEERVMSEIKGSIEAEERIWQIRLDKEGDGEDVERGDDSVDFEFVNDEWEYKLITRTSATKFIKDTFSTIPDLINTYNTYPYDVLRADLLRYLILWYYGGYYADMDIFPKRSIKGCPALSPLFRSMPQSKPAVSLVLGVEIDEPYASAQLLKEWRWSRSYQFIQYNMYAPRRFSPLLRRAIVRTLAHTKQHHDRSSFFSREKYTQNSVLEVSGPGMFTDAILDTLSEALRITHPLITTSVENDRGVGELGPGSKGGSFKRVTWAPFHKIKEPVWVNASDAQDMGGLGVLPVQVWGNGQRHSGAGMFGVEGACINHRFGGTWKKSWWEWAFG